MVFPGMNFLFLNSKSEYFLTNLAMFFFIKHVLFLLLIIFSLRFFGQGAMGHAGETTMARYFGQNRGKALSVSTLGGMTGVMLLPMLIIYLMKYYTLNQIWLAASISIIVFIPIIFLIVATTITKDSTKKLDKKIFEIKENIRILEDRYELILLDYNILTSPKKLMEYQKKYFDNELFEADISSLNWIEIQNGDLEIKKIISNDE